MMIWMSEKWFDLEYTYCGIHLIDNKYNTSYPIDDSLTNVVLFCELLNEQE